MNHHGDERNGRVRGSTLFWRVGARRRDSETLDNEALTDDRLADLVGSPDPSRADRAVTADAPRSDAEADERAGVEAVADGADGSARSASTVTDPAATKDERRSMDQVGDADEAGVDSAVRVLALAQKLHDDYVAEGQNTRDRLISEGQTKYDEFVSTGKARHDGLIAEAEQKRAEVLQGLGGERSLLQKEIEELRSFSRDHRAHLKSYLEGQLAELEQSGTDATDSHDSQEETQAHPG